MDTRLRNLLHDLATEMPVDVEGSGPRTLRRARGRRILTAGAGVAVAVAFVVVSVSVFRFADDPTTPAVSGPNPQPAGFEALWPETDAETLAVTQAAIRDGHDTLRTTPDGTASLLAVTSSRSPRSSARSTACSPSLPGVGRLSADSKLPRAST